MEDLESKERKLIKDLEKKNVLERQRQSEIEEYERKHVENTELLQSLKLQSDQIKVVNDHKLLEVAISDAEMLDRMKEAEVMAATYESLQKCESNLEMEVANKRSTAQKKKDELRAESKRLKARTQNLEDQKAEVASKLMNLDKRRDAFNTLRDGKREFLKQNREKLEKELFFKEAEIPKLESDLRTTRSELKDDLREEEADVLNLKDTLEKLEKKNAEDEILFEITRKERKDAIDTMKARIHAVAEGNDDLALQLKSAVKQRDDSEAELRKAIEDLNIEQEAAAETRRLTEEKTEQINQMNSDIRQAELAVFAKLMEMNEIKAENHKLCAEVEAVMAKSTVVDQEYKEVSSQLEAKEKEVNKLRSQLQETQAEESECNRLNKELKREMQEHEVLLENLKIELEKKQARIPELESSLQQEEKARQSVQQLFWRLKNWEEEFSEKIKLTPSRKDKIDLLTVHLGNDPPTEDRAWKESSELMTASRALVVMRKIESLKTKVDEKKKEIPVLKSECETDREASHQISSMVKYIIKNTRSLNHIVYEVAHLEFFQLPTGAPIDKQEMVLCQEFDKVFQALVKAKLLQYPSAERRASFRRAVKAGVKRMQERQKQPSLTDGAASNVTGGEKSSSGSKDGPQPGEASASASAVPEKQSEGSEQSHQPSQQQPKEMQTLQQLMQSVRLSRASENPRERERQAKKAKQRSASARRPTPAENGSDSSLELLSPTDLRVVSDSMTIQRRISWGPDQVLLISPRCTKEPNSTKEPQASKYAGSAETQKTNSEERK
ncbi:unnamed protein product [Cyprideis torosa]|uniref:Uncharacterized protein n=1 Tax=Cyprideis torosa TaxID=163714 RepID=A0A7R8WRD5_9CRUS|nr:unnamed protein product [Cyprideis torosa]CAG0903574.1 unnamed protein product [Cyprideis torosa]